MPAAQKCITHRSSSCESFLKLKLLQNMNEIAHSETKLVLRQRKESGGTVHRETKNNAAECWAPPTAVSVDIETNLTDRVLKVWRCT